MLASSVLVLEIQKLIRTYNNLASNLRIYFCSLYGSKVKCEEPEGVTRVESVGKNFQRR